MREESIFLERAWRVELLRGISAQCTEDLAPRGNCLTRKREKDETYRVTFQSDS